MNKHYINWLTIEQYNIFATITLKQAFLSDAGTWQPLRSEDVRKTAWIFRDRFAKKLIGRKKTLPFLVFEEGKADFKRNHLHIVTVMPTSFSFSKYKALFLETAAKLDWVHKEIDVREIEPKTQRRVISYSLKEGVGALIPEASWVH